MLTQEDKQLIAEYMGWLFFPSYNYTLKALVGKESVVFFDLNGEDYAERCKMVAEFYGWKADHD